MGRLPLKVLNELPQIVLSDNLPPIAVTAELPLVVADTTYY